jgi:hypothetical protein
MQLLLNIKDQDKASLLMAFLKSLNYVNSVEEVKGSENFIITESHKKIVRDRVKKSKAADLLNWDTIQDDFKGI